MLKDVLSKITEIDRDMMKIVRNRVDYLNKPQGSLGKLEDLVVQVSGITSEAYPMTDKKALIVMCADNGVCVEDVASAPQEVTYIQTLNIPRGLTGAGALAKQMDAKIYAVDIGVMRDIEDEYVINKKVMYGTHNMTKGPAMSRQQAIKALEVGVEIAIKAVEDGAKILATGEMGIGNTSTTTALLSVFTGIDPKEITGIGANFPLEKLAHKAEVIQRSITINQPNPDDVLDVLSKVGGLDIAGMAGTMIGGAYKKVPIIIDGFISTVSAIVACKLNPHVRDYLIPSHYSLEKGAKIATDYLNLDPFLDMNMRLGEGSGALLAFNIVEAACYMNREMITFEEAEFDVL